MRLLKSIVNVVLAVSSIGALAQESARTVQYHSQDIVAIRAKVKYTTLIELPTTFAVRMNSPASGFSSSAVVIQPRISALNATSTARSR